jgi:hypothetical protein
MYISLSIDLRFSFPSKIKPHHRAEGGCLRQQTGLWSTKAKVSGIMIWPAWHWGGGRSVTKWFLQAKRQPAIYFCVKHDFRVKNDWMGAQGWCFSFLGIINQLPNITLSPLASLLEYCLLVEAHEVLRTCDHRCSDEAVDLAYENSHTIFSAPKFYLVKSQPHATTCFQSPHMPVV